MPTHHITNLLDTFSGNLVSLSHHPFGCRVMQRILEHCSDQERYDSFMAEILKVRPHTVAVPVACHLSISISLDLTRGSDWTEPDSVNWCPALTNASCTVCHHCPCSPPLPLQATVQLAQDQYGNYVIQHVVEQGRPHERNQVC